MEQRNNEKYSKERMDELREMQLISCPLYDFMDEYKLHESLVKASKRKRKKKDGQNRSDEFGSRDKIYYYHNIRGWVRHYYIKTYYAENNIYDRFVVSFSDDLTADLDKEVSEIELDKEENISLKEYERKIKKRLYRMLNAILDGYEEDNVKEKRKLLLNEKSKYELDDIDFLFFDWLTDLYETDRGKLIRDGKFSELDSNAINVMRRQLLRLSLRSDNKLDGKKLNSMWEKKIPDIKKRDLNDYLNRYLNMIERLLYEEADKVSINSDESCGEFRKKVDEYYVTGLKLFGLI